MRKLDQNGFHIVEALLVLVVLGILGFTGWFVWHSKQAADKSYKDATKSSQSDMETASIKSFEDCKKAAGSKILTTYPAQCVTKAGKTFTDTSQAQQYVTIKEWNVRASYSGSLTLSYDIDKNGNAEFSAKQLDDFVAGSSVSCKGFAGMIARYSSDQHLNADDSQPTAADAAKNGASLTRIGNYYYQFVHVQAACEGDLPSSFTDAQSNQLNMLITQANNDVKAITSALQPV